MAAAFLKIFVCSLVLLRFETAHATDGNEDHPTLGKVVKHGGAIVGFVTPFALNIAQDLLLIEADKVASTVANAASDGVLNTPQSGLLDQNNINIFSKMVYKNTHQSTYRSLEERIETTGTFANFIIGTAIAVGWERLLPSMERLIRYVGQSIYSRYTGKPSRDEDLLRHYAIGALCVGAPFALACYILNVKEGIKKVGSKLLYLHLANEWKKLSKRN